MWVFLDDSILPQRCTPRRRGLFLQSIHAAGDAALKNGFPEVQKVSELQASQAQAGLHLLLISSLNPFDRFKLKEHPLLDDDVSPEPLSNSLVVDWDRNLPLDI